MMRAWLSVGVGVAISLAVVACSQTADPTPTPSRAAGDAEALDKFPNGSLDNGDWSRWWSPIADQSIGTGAIMRCAGGLAGKVGPDTIYRFRESNTTTLPQTGPLEPDNFDWPQSRARFRQEQSGARSTFIARTPRAVNIRTNDDGVRVARGEALSLAKGSEPGDNFAPRASATTRYCQQVTSAGETTRNPLYPRRDHIVLANGTPDAKPGFISTEFDAGLRLRAPTDTALGQWSTSVIGTYLTADKWSDGPGQTELSASCQPQPQTPVACQVTTAVAPSYKTWLTEQHIYPGNALGIVGAYLWNLPVEVTLRNNAAGLIVAAAGTTGDKPADPTRFPATGLSAQAGIVINKWQGVELRTNEVTNLPFMRVFRNEAKPLLQNVNTWNAQKQTISELSAVKAGRFGLVLRLQVFDLNRTLGECDTAPITNRNCGILEIQLDSALVPGSEGVVEKVKARCQRSVKAAASNLGIDSLTLDSDSYSATDPQGIIKLNLTLATNKDCRPIDADFLPSGQPDPTDVGH